MGSSRYELTKARNGGYQFTLKSEQDVTIFLSERYASKASAEHAIAYVQHNAGCREQYQCCCNERDQHYFVLMAKNQQVIGMSNIYTSDDALNSGISSAIECAATANILDLTLNRDLEH